MNVTLFLFLLFGLQGLYGVVGRRASKAATQDAETYFLAGKQVRFFPLMMTFLATQVGGGALLGSAEEAYHFGWPVLLYPLGIALGLILLGSGIGRKLATFRVSTVAQLFEIVYRSPLLKKGASLLSIVSLSMILVAQIIASRTFLVSLGCTSLPLFLLFWAVVIYYTIQGGLRAVIATDLIQALFFSLIFLFTAAFILGSSHPPSCSLVQITPLPFATKWCGWLLMPSLFMVIEQDMGQRCLAGASPRVVSRASLGAGIATLGIGIIPIYLGTLARTLGLVAPSGGSILMTVITHTTPSWLSAFVGCAILAAIISTASSLISALSSNLSQDFSWSRFPAASGLRLIKILTLVLCGGALLFSFHSSGIVDLLIQSYELSVSALFIPILLALLRKKGEFLAALLSFLFGSSAFLLLRILPTPLPKELLSIAFSFGGYLIGAGVAFRQKVKLKSNTKAW